MATSKRAIPLTGSISQPGGSTFLAVDAPAADVFAGSFSGMIENTAEASNAFVRQANIGIGIVQPSTQVKHLILGQGFWRSGGRSIRRVLL